MTNETQKAENAGLTRQQVQDYDPDQAVADARKLVETLNAVLKIAAVQGVKIEVSAQQEQLQGIEFQTQRLAVSAFKQL